jgi:quercetin dioxygenase-like cupin family protein
MAGTNIGKRTEQTGLVPSGSFYFGNSVADQVRDSGWFVGQFVPAALGLRHQDAVEVKWGIHPDGEKRPQPWANEHGTTISVLIRGILRVTFHVGETPQTVTLEKEGDYVIFAPKTMHSWEAIGHTVVLSVRFPSVEVWRAARTVEDSGRG